MKLCHKALLHKNIIAYKGKDTLCYLYIYLMYLIYLSTYT